MSIQSFPAGMTVGLVPMSAKPIHAGHYMLIELAANENDHVLLYVSLSDRKRKGEIAISGNDMQQIWAQYIEPILPGNVEVEYGGIPVRKVYEQLGEEAERFAAGDLDVASYSIYSDPDDMSKNFPEKNMNKYAGPIWEAGLIDRRKVDRTSTVDVSGTKMRQMIAAGNEEEFMSYLPDVLDDSSRQAIWQILSA